jgi:hypothetical protein
MVIGIEGHVRLLPIPKGGIGFFRVLVNPTKTIIWHPGGKDTFKYL